MAGSGTCNVRRVYITGAQCSGVSSLGRKLAECLTLPCIDIDQLGWDRTGSGSPAASASCLSRLNATMTADGWIFCGPAEGWADEVLLKADHIIFLTAETRLRLQRLIERDRVRYGKHIEPGGLLHNRHVLHWNHALLYDDPRSEGPNRLRQEHWLLKLTKPVQRLDGALPLADLAERALFGIRRPGMVSQRS